MDPIAWNIRLDGRSWSEAESWERWDLTPEKLEMANGKLLWNDEDRIALLGLLLENVGARRAVRMGSAAVWKQAVAELDLEP